MKFELHRPLSRTGTPIKWWAYAGVTWTADKADVYVLEGHVTEKRVAHEVAHPLLGEHHSPFHFCLRVFHGLRSWDHGSDDVRRIAQELVRDGEASLSP